MIGCLMVMLSIQKVYANPKEEGRIVANFGDKITLVDGREVDYNPSSTLLFFNGSLITDYDFTIHNGTTEIPLSFISKELGASIQWNAKEQKLILQKEDRMVRLRIVEDIRIENSLDLDKEHTQEELEQSIYVPLRYVSEELGYSVSFHHRGWKSGKSYYDTNMEIPVGDCLVEGFHNIIIDKKYDFEGSPSPEEALNETKKVCMEGYINFSESIKKQIQGSNHLDGDLKRIEQEINRMIYIGEVSRYYKFSMGIYDILYDRINGKIYFIIYSSGAQIEEVDIHSPSLYIPLFIVG